MTKKNNKKSKTNDKLDLILLLIFIVLLINTIFLGYKVITKKTAKHDTSSIIIPVLGPNINSEFSIDVSNMNKGDSRDYTFTICNYKDNNINKESVLYALQLLEYKDLEIKIYKNDSKNIMSSDGIIIDNNLKSNKKQNDIYNVKIKANKKTDNKQLLTVKVIS